jgi:serine O-acetyltransferase
VLADAARSRGAAGTTPAGWVTVLALACRNRVFAAVLAYRIRTELQRRRVPVLPTLLHRFSMAVATVCIGDPVIIGPGLHLPAGRVVIDGITQVGASVEIGPEVTIGLKEGNFFGPTLGDGVRIGAGAKVLGLITVGHDAVVEPEAVVTADVPPDAVVAGVPGRVVDR